MPISGQELTRTLEKEGARHRGRAWKSSLTSNAPYKCGCPPGVVRGSACQATIASSENQTVRLPRWRKAASYSAQFVTRRRCFGIRWRRAALALNGIGGSRVTEGVVLLRQPPLHANRPIRATNSPRHDTRRSRGRTHVSTHVSTRPRATPLLKISLAPKGASTHVANSGGVRGVVTLPVWAWGLSA